MDANKLFLRLLTTFVLLLSTWGLLVETPAPKELANCFMAEKERNKITEVYGEKINNICEDLFLMQHKKKVKFEPTQKDIDTVNSILLRYIAKTRRTKRQTSRWRRRRNRRKEIRLLNNAERGRLHNAFQEIKRNGIYDSIAAIHRGESRLLRAHGGANFLSWHRIMLKVLELSLQDVDRRIRLPYYDSSLDFYIRRPEDSIVWTADFFGNCRGDVTEGPYANWELGLDPSETLFRNCGSGGTLMTKEGIRNVMRADFHANITDVRNILQFLEGYHNGLHVWTDGWMRLLYSAAEDPLFFFHHCFIDYIWYKFRQRQRLRGIDPEGDYPNLSNRSLHRGDATMDPFYFMSNSDGYLDMWEADYEETPSCNRRRPRCGSRRYLTCNRREERCETRTQARRPQPRVGGINAISVPRVGGIQALSSFGRPTIARLNFGEVDAPTIRKTLPFGAAEFSSPFTDIRTENVKPLDTRPFEPNAVRKKRSVSIFTDSRTEKSYQNSFLLDGVADTSLWSFFPVQVVYKRPPGIQYNSKIVTEGRKIQSGDIYSPSNYQDIDFFVSNSSAIADNGRCLVNGNGEFKIYFQSQGIDYNGFYKDYVIVDGKQALTSSYGYLAMKNPGNYTAEAYLSAYDECGRMCQTACQIRGSQPSEYKSCSGSVKITPELPKMYGEDYGEAVSLLWNLNQGSTFPTVDPNQIFIKFYCDYQPIWPWTF